MVSGTSIFLWIFIHNRLWSQSQKRFEYVSKTAWELVNKSSLIWWYVLKTSLRHPQDVLKTFLQDILKTFWRRLEDAFKTFLQDLWPRQIYWSWSRRLEDVLKTSSRCLEDIFARHLEDAFKTFLQDVLKTPSRRLQDLWPRQIYWSWSRRTEDVLKTSLSRRMFAGIIASKCGPLVRIEKQAMSWKSWTYWKVSLK